MLAAEARWFRDRLAAWPAERLFPLCNVGSAAGEGQLREQPWIERDVFGPLKKLPGARISNCDLFPGAGVDLVGDLTEPAFRERLADLGVKAIFCANVLEHVPEPARLAAGLSALLPPGGLLFVSVPQAFPYHPDPIDTLFRPTPAELTALFPDLKPLTAESVAAQQHAEELAHRALARDEIDGARLVWAFQVCTSRNPTYQEVGILLQSLEKQRKLHPGNLHAAYTSVMRVLLNLDETLHKN